MKRIIFTVPDEVANEMHHRSVFLDVFGNVRWRNDDEPVVEGSTRWEVEYPPVSFCTPGCPDFCTGSPNHARGEPPSPEAIAELRRRLGLDRKPSDSGAR